MTKSPREVCTVAVYFFVWSITLGGGVVRCSMQVTISLSQPGAKEVAGEPWSEPHAASASAASAVASPRLIDPTLKDRARPPTTPHPPSGASLCGRWGCCADRGVGSTQVVNARALRG